MKLQINLTMGEIEELVYLKNHLNEFTVNDVLYAFSIVSSYIGEEYKHDHRYISVKSIHEDLMLSAVMKYRIADNIHNVYYFPVGGAR